MASNSNTNPTIVFWNCRGLRRHLISGALQALLNPRLTPCPPAIVVLVETHWSSTVPYHRTTTTQLPSLPHYSWLYRHHTNRSGGLAILYHNSIACLPMHSLDAQCNPISLRPDSPSAVLWHTVRFPHTAPFLLGAGYLAPDDNDNNSLASEAMCKAMRSATALALPMLLVGDFNHRVITHAKTQRERDSDPRPLGSRHTSKTSWTKA